MRNIRNVPGHFSGLIELWRDLLWYISHNFVYVARTDERDISSFFSFVICIFIHVVQSG